ncbi:DUF2917 domain-containing protein [Noviherbaspirillum sp.]|uniref:DUF2917 domain-containing protein n=1 Tax=Noviherbaspirillum sp. TaxID=1926288 RepID=UPI002B48CB20|nr:DUF2917 domain-containing protein [Noviherbaspirillum sp.]HJV81175.1 DUF2917 domain-containing protein [Noviherbaspirillum sp.]
MHATVHKTFAVGHHHDRDGAAPESLLKLDPAGELVRLQAKQHLRLHKATGWTVRVLAGAVWLTQDGDIRDIVLQAGESYVLDRKEPALLSPFKDAQICIQRDTSRQATSRSPLARSLSPATACASLA